MRPSIVRLSRALQRREYNNEKYHRLFYFSRATSRASVNSRFARPSRILRPYPGVKFPTNFQERARGRRDEERRRKRLPFYLREILLRRESTRRSEKRARASARLQGGKDIPRGADRTCTKSHNLHFHPSSHEVVNPRSPGRNFGKHRR